MNNVYSQLFKFTSHFKIPKNQYILQGLTGVQFRNNFANMTVPSQTNKNIFQGDLDRFNGITVDSSNEACDLVTFSAKLIESLKIWTDTKKRGIWFKVAVEQSDWVPILAKNGFDFHHAKSGYVMMNKWLPNEPSRLPQFAHTMLAIGSVVINDKSEVLAVQEKNYAHGHWKFPGGIVEPGENLVEAAIREVKEETNIDFEFESLISFMHADKGIYGCSDLYVIAAGKALSTDIKICEKEIAKCKWYPIEEYLSQENITDFNKALLKHYLEYQKNGVKIDFINGVHQLSKRSYTMYSINFK